MSKHPVLLELHFHNNASFKTKGNSNNIFKRKVIQGQKKSTKLIQNCNFLLN